MGVQGSAYETLHNPLRSTRYLCVPCTSRGTPGGTKDRRMQDHGTTKNVDDGSKESEKK